MTEIQIEEARFSRCRLATGDVVVVTVQDRLSRDMAADVQKKLEAVFGDDNTVLLLDGGVEIFAMSRDLAGLEDVAQKARKLHSLLTPGGGPRDRARRALGEALDKLETDESRSQT